MLRVWRFLLLAALTVILPGPADDSAFAQQGIDGLPGLPAKPTTADCENLQRIYDEGARRLRDEAFVQEYRVEVEYRMLRERGVPEVEARYQAERVRTQSTGDLRARATRTENTGRQLAASCHRRADGAS